MGYFAYLYLIECGVLDQDHVELVTSVYRGGADPKPYFSWISGKRPEKVNAYANRTIFSDKELELITPYPVRETQELGCKLRHIETGILVQADFTPRRSDEETVCHVILPPRFLPRRDLEPLTQPHLPHVNVNEEQITLTWPIEGGFRIEFIATPLDKNDSLSKYIHADIMRPITDRRSRMKPNFNVGLNINFPSLW